MISSVLQLCHVWNLEIYYCSMEHTVWLTTFLISVFCLLKNGHTTKLKSLINWKLFFVMFYFSLFSKRTKMKKQQKNQKWFHLNYGIFIPFRRESEYGKEKGEYFLRKKQISTINFRILDIFLMVLDYNQVLAKFKEYTIFSCISIVLNILHICLYFVLGIKYYIFSKIYYVL